MDKDKYNQSLLSLKPGDIVAFDLYSRGCASEHRIYYRFLPGNPARLEVDTYRAWGAKQFTKVGVAVTLTLAQVKRLDNLLIYYRSKPTNISTTKETINVKWSTQNNMPRWEHFLDGSSATDYLADASLEDLKRARNAEYVSTTFGLPILSLFKVHEQATKAKARGLRTVAYHDTPRLQTEAFARAQEHEEKEAVKKEARRLLTSLPQYEKVAMFFTLSRFDIVNVSGYGKHVEVVCTPKISPSLSIKWENSMRKGKLRYSWGDFLQAYEKIQMRVNRCEWISRWQQEKVDRTLAFTLNSLRGYDDYITQTEPIDNNILRAWRKAGLRGKPTYKICLLSKDRFVEVWLSDNLSEKRTLAFLLVLASPLSNKSNRALTHFAPLVWFESDEIDFCVETGARFLIIESDGQAQGYR
jgi:hypothetical protein